MNTNRVLGVLGGMGPLATVGFLRNLIERTPATSDQDHIPCITHSVPQIPCRVAAILDDGPSPLPALLDGIHILEKAGVQAIAMPCVTAHYWFEDLAATTPLPILHIAQATIEVLAETLTAGSSVGVLATRATLKAGHFQRSLTDAGYATMTPDCMNMEQCVLPAIANVKIGHHQDARRFATRAVEMLLDQGAERVVLACTELPVALNGAQNRVTESCIDTVDALALACVTWAGATN